jgi:hypothetical protein
MLIPWLPWSTHITKAYGVLEWQDSDRTSFDTNPKPESWVFHDISWYFMIFHHHWYPWYNPEVCNDTCCKTMRWILQAWQGTRSIPWRSLSGFLWKWGTPPNQIKGLSSFFVINTHTYIYIIIYVYTYIHAYIYIYIHIYVYIYTRVCVSKPSF